MAGARAARAVRLIRLADDADPTQVGRRVADPVTRRSRSDAPD